MTPPKIAIFSPKLGPAIFLNYAFACKASLKADGRRPLEANAGVARGSKRRKICHVAARRSDKVESLWYRSNRRCRRKKLPSARAPKSRFS